MLNLAFAGTPAFAARALEALLAAGYPVRLVLTQPDRPAGRGQKLQPSEVKQVALAHGLPLAQPDKLRTPEQQQALREAAPDVLVVAAYGLILPQAVLDIRRVGCVNFHASLLPRWRGAAPIHRAIEAGDAETGITIMQMDAGLDTGPMLLARAIPIGSRDTTASLHDRLAGLGAQLIVEALAGLEQGTLTAQPQPEAGVTYAGKIDKREAALDFRLPAQVLARKLRAFDPFPGGAALLAGEPVKLWAAVAEGGGGAPGTVLAADASGVRIACGEGVLRVTELQKAGARRLAAADWLRGNPLPPGSRFELPSGD